MSGKFRYRLQTAVLVFIVSLISVVFVLQFGGPQAEGCTTADSGYVAKVSGQTITEGDLRAHRKLSGFDRFPEQVVKQLGLNRLALEGMIDRVLLADKARDIGLRIEEEAVMRQIAESGTARVSLGSDAPFGLAGGERPIPVQDEQGRFDQEAAKRFIQFGLQRSIGGFLAAQQQEVLAQNMRDLVRSSVTATRAELWRLYVRDKNRRAVSYIRFDPDYYRAKMTPSAEALAQYDAAYKAEIDAAFKKQKKGDESITREDVLDTRFRETQAKALAKKAAEDALSKVKSGNEAAWESLSEALYAASQSGSSDETASAETQPELESDKPAMEAESDALAPTVQTTSAFSRVDAPLPGVADAGDFVKAAFALEKEGSVYAKLLSLGDEFVVMRLDTKEEATEESFAAERDAFASKRTDDLRAAAEKHLVAYLRQSEQDSIEIKGSEEAQPEDSAEAQDPDPAG